MNFNDKKKAYIDSEGFCLIELVEEKTIANNTDISKSYLGSLEHKISVDLTNRMVDAPYYISETNYFGTTSKYEVYAAKSIGLDSTGYSKLKKLVNTVTQEKSVYNKISKEFVEKKIFEWLIKTYKEGRADTCLSTFLLNDFENSLEHIRFRFRILNLDIKRPFQIGKATFGFFTKDYFDHLIKYSTEKGTDASIDTYEHLRKKYQGQVFVSYAIIAEKEKAEELALEYCSIAIDILKMCSQTTDLPFVKLGFDIDSRLKFNSQTEVIVTLADNEFERFSVDYSSPVSPHNIDDIQWKGVLNRHIGIFHEFLLSLDDNLSELQSLIINSIKRYGNAISNHNLHQRTVELFTILESLLLNDGNTPIIESVCKYSSKLIFKKIDDRKDAIGLLKKMYEVRSKLIHHGKEAKFEMEDLSKLQRIVLLLLVVLVGKSKKHQTKHGLLQEIEDAIMQAYG